MALMTVLCENTKSQAGLSPWDEDSLEKCASDLVHLDGHTNPQAQAWETSLPPPTLNYFSFFLSC